MSLINCKECGKEISESAGSCPHCGFTNSCENPGTGSNGKTIKCPKCGSSDLQAISDVKGKGASFWKICFCGILGLCGTGKTKTEHYWACKSCGYKFKI